MAVSFELPAEIEQNLRRSIDDLDGAAKEAALVDLYRQDRLSQHELAQALGISRLQTEALHNVTEDLPSADEIQEDIENLRRLLGK